MIHGSAETHTETLDLVPRRLKPEDLQLNVEADT
jgi:hypothetical protein